MRKASGKGTHKAVRDKQKKRYLGSGKRAAELESLQRKREHWSDNWAYGPATFAKRMADIANPPDPKLIVQAYRNVFSPTGRIANYEPEMQVLNVRRGAEEIGLVNIDYSGIEERMAAHMDAQVRSAFGMQTNTITESTEENTLTIDKLKTLMAELKVSTSWNTVLFSPYVRRQVVRWGCLILPWQAQYMQAVIASLGRVSAFPPRIRVGGPAGSRGRRMQRRMADLRRAREASKVQPS